MTDAIKINYLLPEGAINYDNGKVVLETTVVAGQPGADGDQGPPGNDGLTSLRYDHDQQIASNVWTIDHNFGRRPFTIMVIDTNGDEVFGEVSHPTTNRTTITFSAPFSGLALLGA